VKYLLFDKFGDSMAKACQAVCPYSIWVFEKFGNLAGFLGGLHTNAEKYCVCINNNKYYQTIYIIYKNPYSIWRKWRGRFLPNFAKLSSYGGAV